MKAIPPLLLMAGLSLSGCGRDDSVPSKSKTGSSSGNPVTAPVDYLGAVGKAKHTADKTLTAAGLDQSIKMFYAQEGRFPKNLEELVQPSYLNAIPPPPVGMKYTYDANSGVVKVVPK